jgi:hypothetical protein
MNPSAIIVFASIELLLFFSFYLVGIKQAQSALVPIGTQWTKRFTRRWPGNFKFGH